MDPVAQIRLTRQLIDIDSTTGREGEVARHLAAVLRDLGYTLIEQPLGDGRFNIVATVGTPTVTFSTHFDCVPPFVPSREADGRLYGRGACDAKGILVAQLAAAERLRASGETRVGLLFVAGEERGSDGARAANALASGTKFLVNGEPTDNRLAAATRGVYRVRVSTAGRAAHSSRPDLGESAIEKLLDALVALRAIDWPVHPLYGRTHYSIGMIEGGVAPNVIPPAASAEVMFRTVGSDRDLRSALERSIGASAALDDVLVVPPVMLKTLPGFETAVFAFTTDIPFLDRWGTPLLIGPGSATLAHTADEHVATSELHHAVDLYAMLATTLLLPAVNFRAGDVSQSG
jgi:acetylornithine deacetylase